jgi:hypothetical protein
MHIEVKDPLKKDIVGVLCIERDSHSAIILEAEIEYLETLVSIAKSQKVPLVTLVVPHGAVPELQALGWQVDDTRVVLTKGGNGNGS